MQNKDIIKSQRPEKEVIQKIFDHESFVALLSITTPPVIQDFPQRRFAVSNDDFQEIYDRERIKRKEGGAHVFKELLQEIVIDSMETHKADYKGSLRNLDLITTAYSFLEWLKNRDITAKKIIIRPGDESKVIKILMAAFYLEDKNNVELIFTGMPAMPIRCKIGVTKFIPVLATLRTNGVITLSKDELIVFINNNFLKTNGDKIDPSTVAGYIRNVSEFRGSFKDLNFIIR